MLKHKYKIAAIVVCFIFFSLALFSSAGFNWKNLKFSGNGILADEIPHIAAGYYYLNTHRDYINPEHPPLVKDIAGLGELIIHPKLPNITDQEILPPDFHRAEYPFVGASFPKALEWQNNQDHFGTMYLFQPGNNPDKIAFFARLAVILANSLLLFLLYYLLTKIWTERAAILSLFFFAISQFSIAHGSYVVIDFMSAVLTGIAIVSFAIYLKKSLKSPLIPLYKGGDRLSPFRKGRVGEGFYFFLTSLFFALALLSKFSSVVLLPAAFIGGLIFVLFLDVQRLKAQRRWTSNVFKYIFSYAAVVMLALFLVSAFYVFHTYKMENDVLIQKINENYPEEQLPQTGHKILELMVYMNPLTKGLAAYANGTFMVVSRMVVSAQSTYFLGHVYGNEGAGLWYFPVLYLAKLSPGLHLFSLLTLVLFVISVVVLRRQKKKYQEKVLPNPLAFLLWAFIVCYMAITLRSTFQIGLRHIMPVILAAALLTGRGTDLFWKKRLYKFFKVKHLFAIVATGMLISVFASFPYYLESYNVFAGGTDKGYKIATDSNYDWGGSDVRRLGKWMRDNNVRDIYTQMFADVPLKYYLGDGQKNFNLRDDGPLPPSGSYIAVSNYEYMNNVYSADIPPDHKYTTLENDLVARAGKTIFVYKIP